MRKVYQKELLARRCVVQAIYQQMFNPCHDLVSEFHKDIKINESIFVSVLMQVLNEWDEFEQELFSLIEKDDLILMSACAKSILRAALAELKRNPERAKILINDYLEVANMFCAKEKPFLNKIMDKFHKTLLTR